MNDQFQVEIISDLSPLLEIEEEWNEINYPAGTPLMDFDWFMTCAENLHQENEIQIFLIRNAGKIEAIAPLFIARKGFVKYLRILGVSTLYEPAGILYKNTPSLQRLLQAILQSGYPIILERIPDNSQIWNELLLMENKKGLCFKRPTAKSAYLHLDMGWNDFVAMMSASRRTDFRRIRRRSEEVGKVEFHVLAPDPQNLEDVLNTAFQIEASGWKKKRGTAVLCNPLLHNFFYTYMNRICLQGKLRAFFMYIGETPVAMHLAVVHAKRLWILKIGYNEEWSKLSPGLQVCMESIRYAINNNLVDYEFLGTEEKWQHTWPINLHPYNVIAVFPFTFQGILGFALTSISFLKSKVSSILVHSEKT